MLRKIHCQSERDAERFTTAFQAFCFGRVVTLQIDLKGEPQKREDRRLDLGIVRAFEAISTPDPSLPKLHGDVIARVLTDDSTLVLKQTELDRLDKYINRGPCDTGHLVALEDCLDWLAASEKVDE